MISMLFWSTMNLIGINIALAPVLRKLIGAADWPWSSIFACFVVGTLWVLASILVQGFLEA